MSISNTLTNVPDSVYYLEITALQAGQRIDNFLQNQLKGVPRSHIYRILRTGEVRVNKGRIKPTYRLVTGDRLRIPPLQRDPPAPPANPSERALSQLRDGILYEDKSLLVINKAAGMAVHGGSGVSYGVIEGLRALYPQAPYLELVHRLDRDTSGCLLIAKKPAMLRRLHALLRESQLGKEYLALVRGIWPAELRQVDAPLLKNVLQSGERIVRVDPAGKPALSHFRLQRHFGLASLVEVKLSTGRTHQIRVHASAHDHPLAGDDKYGDEAFNRQLRDDYGLQRLFLHAARIVIPAGDDQPSLQFDAPLPADLSSVLTRLDTP